MESMENMASMDPAKWAKEYHIPHLEMALERCKSTGTPEEPGPLEAAHDLFDTHRDKLLRELRQRLANVEDLESHLEAARKFLKKYERELPHEVRENLTNVVSEVERELIDLKGKVLIELLEITFERYHANPSIISKGDLDSLLQEAREFLEQYGEKLPDELSQRLSEFISEVERELLKKEGENFISGLGEVLRCRDRGLLIRFSVDSLLQEARKFLEQCGKKLPHELSQGLSELISEVERIIPELREKRLIEE